MTFAIARKIGKSIFMLSDTRISFQNTPLPINQGVIKTAFLSSDIAISFCHSPESAQTAIEAYCQRLGPRKFSETIAYFEKSSSDTGNGYLLTFAKSQRIFKIEDGHAKDGSAAWIGDYLAFRKFRELETVRKVANADPLTSIFLGPLDRLPKNISAVTRLLEVFSAVLHSSDTPSTGGFLTAVACPL